MSGSSRRARAAKAQAIQKAQVSSEAEATRRATASIISPATDLLLVGGLSVLVFIPMLLSGRTDLLIIGAGAQAWLATTINMPHFMASYRIVYRSRDMIMRHKWATLYVPAILLAYCALALWEARQSPILVTILVAVSSAYLAWHYTGQVWGMMASYSYLEGKPFDKTERLLIRASLRILLAWHVTWFLYTQLSNTGPVRPVYLLVSFATLVALALGAAGLYKAWRRTGAVPPKRALVAWLALFTWYAMMARDPQALFWVQIAHALQYLAFPIRVELNRARPSPAYGKLAWHMAVYGVGLLTVSYLLAQVLPGTAMSVVGGVFGEEPGRAVPILMLMLINIHHYFTDGVIWKISNPEVRKELFAHVQQPSASGKNTTAPPVAAPDYSPSTPRKVRR